MEIFGVVNASPDSLANFSVVSNEEEAKRYGAAAADAAAAAVLASVNSITFGRLMAHNVSFFSVLRCSNKERWKGLHDSAKWEHPDSAKWEQL